MASSSSFACRPVPGVVRFVVYWYVAAPQPDDRGAGWPEFQEPVRLPLTVSAVLCGPPVAPYIQYRTPRPCPWRGRSAVRRRAVAVVWLPPADGNRRAGGRSACGMVRQTRPLDIARVGSVQEAPVERTATRSSGGKTFHHGAGSDTDRPIHTGQEPGDRRLREGAFPLTADGRRGGTAADGSDRRCRDPLRPLGLTVSPLVVPSSRR
jgi:hypothetical protein